MTAEEGQLLLDILFNRTISVYVMFLGIGFACRILCEVANFRR